MTHPTPAAHALAAAMFEAECGIPPNSLTMQLSLWHRRVEHAQKVLDIFMRNQRERTTHEQ
jgi:hypothetical protein